MHKIKRSINDTYTMVLRSMKHTVRHTEILIMTAFLPLMQLLLLVYVFGGTIQIPNFTYLDYVLPGILLMGIASSASMTAISVKEDMEKGIIDRFRSMDIAKSAVMNGHMVATLVRTGITMAVILSAAFLLGFRFHMSLSDGLLAFALIFAFTLMYTWASIAWGLFCPSLEAVGAFSYFGMLLPYLSSCFVPVSNLPEFLQLFTDHQPFTPLAESLRGLFLGQPVGDYLFNAFVWCAILLFVFYAAAMHLYHKRKAS